MARPSVRTTLTIDEDVLAVARELAASEGRSIGEILSRLARRGLVPSRRLDEEGGFPVFAVPEGAPPITAEMVSRALEDPEA